VAHRPGRVLGTRLRGTKKKSHGKSDVLTGDHLHYHEDADSPVKSSHSPRRILTEQEQRLLSHHPGTPEDHQHNLNAPLDRKTDRLLREGALDDVISLAELAPTRVAEAMGRHRLVLERLAGHGSHDKLLALTWDSLDAESRRRNFKRMLRMVLKMARQVSSHTSRRDGPLRTVPFRFHGDELEMDASLEKLFADSTVVNGRLVVANYADFRVTERARRPCSYVIILDESRSMRGSKAVAAALAAAVLLLNLQPEDEYAVTAFASEARVIRPTGLRRIHEQIIQDILEMKPGGCTDVAEGLKIGLSESRRANALHNVGILVSDGWLNTGKDPLPLVRQFSRLHVIELPGGDHDLCTEMAKIGNGVVVSVRELNEVPSAVRRCLAA
jgi:Mg-chelatase subunit ChlD